MNFCFSFIAALLFCLSSISYGEPGNSSPRYSCGVLVDVYDSQYFDTEAKAQSMCNTFYNIYKVENGCAVRGLSDNTWEANFRFRKYFVGNNSRQDYAEWSKASVHQGYMIRHQVWYSGKCQTEYDY